MDTELQNRIGKSAGEVARDIADFLSCSCTVRGQKEMDLASILPELNMREQFAFAFLMEAHTQGWEPAAAEGFLLRAYSPVVSSQAIEGILEAFRDPHSEAFASYLVRYGCDFGLSSPSYWTSALAVAIDAKAIPQLMAYLREFLFCLMEFAYMEERNPEKTYAWSYYESFNRILAELTTPEETPDPLKIRAIGGTAGKKEGNDYLLTLGVDLENPNPSHMAWNIQIDITLKDKEGNVITVIADQIHCIDPNSVFHYGITRKIRGEAVAHISATAKAGAFTKLSTPIMNHFKLVKPSIKRNEGEGRLSGTLVGSYDCSISSYALHYQFLSAENKILGGGSEWFYEEFPAGGEKSFSMRCPVPVKNAAKVVYSVDFNVQELL